MFGYNDILFNDSGKNIDGKDIDSLFEMFFNNTTDEDAGGAGDNGPIGSEPDGEEEKTAEYEGNLEYYINSIERTYLASIAQTNKSWIELFKNGEHSIKKNMFIFDYFMKKDYNLD